MSGLATSEPSSLPAWAVVSPPRAGHIARVEALLAGWAEARGVGVAEAARWRRAARLHDALRDATSRTLARHLPRGAWPKGVWHGPAAAAAAAAAGETDPGVLDAVRYHSVGFAEWDEVGRMLYLADYLEPGRTHERAALDAIAARVPSEPEAMLREVAARRIGWLLARGKPVMVQTWEFWNSLAAGDSSSSR